MGLASRPNREKPFWRTLLHVAALDLLVGLGLVFVCVESLHIADPRVLIPLYLGHSVVSFVQLTRVLAPARGWRWGEADEHEERAVDRALDEAYGRFAPIHVVGTIVAVALALGLAYVGVPAVMPFGVAEFVFGLMLVLAVTLALPVLLRPLFDSALIDFRTKVGAALVEHSGRSRSVGRRVLVLNLGMLASVLVSLTGSALLVQTHGSRAEILAGQRGRAALAAAELRGGLRIEAELESGLELVETDDLPAQLSQAAEAAQAVKAAQAATAGPGTSALGQVVAVLDLARDEALAAARIDNGRWVLARAPTQQDLAVTMVLVLMAIVLALAPATLANLALNRSLMVPLAQLDGATRRIADEGKLHSLARIVPLSNDELGSLATNFNRMLDVLDELAAAAASVAEGDLRVELQGPGDLQDAFRGMLARLHEVVVQIRGTSLDLASAAGEIQATTRRQENAVDQQSQRMAVVSDAVASLALSAEEISETATEVLDNAERAQTMTDVMVERITALGAASGSVNQLLELIREIADRSDLLALNGSLEATRAGEAGRGFALVATEMRRLAERVTGTVADVRERIGEIEAAGASTVMATEDSRKLADSTAAAARRISEVTTHQSQETDQVSLDVLEVAEVMSATVDATRQTHSAADGLHRQAAELERLTAQFKLREPGQRSS